MATIRKRSVAALRGTLISIEIGRRPKEAWAHVSWGDDNELIVPISGKGLPEIVWSATLLEEVQKAVRNEASDLAAATVM